MTMAAIAAGIDVTPVARMARWLTDHATRLDDVFTPRERAHCDAGSGGRRAERYAVAFAAKEAVMKALGTGWRSDVQWVEIDTRPADASGTIRLSGRASAVARAQGVERITVSTSAACGGAFATAIAVRHA